MADKKEAENDIYFKKEYHKTDAERMRNSQEGWETRNALEGYRDKKTDQDP